jgi:hypothetical protein
MASEESSIKSILLTILAKQEQVASSLAIIYADLETLRMALPLLSSDPAFGERLEAGIQMNRSRFAEEVAQKQADLALLRADISKTVQ